MSDSDSRSEKRKVNTSGSRGASWAGWKTSAGVTRSTSCLLPAHVLAETHVPVPLVARREAANSGSGLLLRQVHFGKVSFAQRLRAHSGNAARRGCGALVGAASLAAGVRQRALGAAGELGPLRLEGCARGGKSRRPGRTTRSRARGLDAEDSRNCGRLADEIRLFLVYSQPQGVRAARGRVEGPCPVCGRPADDARRMSHGQQRTEDLLHRWGHAADERGSAPSVGQEVLATREFASAARPLAGAAGGAVPSGWC